MASDSMGVGIGIAVIILFVLLYLMLLAYAVVSYILGSKGLYTIAARRGIKNPWMAWIPVAGNWILGCVSDQYQQRKYGEDPNLRKKLLIWSIITQSGSIASPAISISLDFSTESGLFEEIMQSDTGRIIAITLLTVLFVIAIGFLVLSIIQMVYLYKAYYSLYASCKPRMAVAFLLLSILTPAGPFLTYACRNSDEGLPVQTQE